MGRKKLHTVKLTGRVPAEIAEKYRQLARDTGFTKATAAGEVTEMGELLTAIMIGAEDQGIDLRKLISEVDSKRGLK